jgi:hypothetical protein
MQNSSKTAAATGEAKSQDLEKPARSAEMARRGVRTGADFANLMSALMSDIIEGKVTPDVGNAACNAGGKLLKVVEMQHRYGTRSKNGEQVERVLILSNPEDGAQ